MVVQCNPSIAAIIGEWNFGHYRGMALSRGFCLSNVQNGDAIGTKVSGRYRDGGRLSWVAIKRSSTVYWMYSQLTEGTASSSIVTHVTALAWIRSDTTPAKMPPGR